MIRRDPSGKTVSQAIAEFIFHTGLKDIPAVVRESAKMHLLDGLATMLGGAQEASSRLLRGHFQSGKSGASVIGAGEKFSLEHAALINGVQAHVLDYDDGQLTTLPSRPMGQQTHPTSPVLAALLALAESRRATGGALLASYVVGVEVACRLGDAVDPSHYLDGFHPTGTLGVFGAAAACAHLLQLPPNRLRQALGIAGTLAAGLRANRGTMAKGLNAGRAAENGVLAATLAAAGFSASENIFEDPMGFFPAACRNRVDAKQLRFGRPFFFARPGIAVKLYPCAGVLHPALDVALALRNRYALNPSAIARVKIILDDKAALPLVYDRPKDPLQSKFSAHFALAAALVDGAAGLRQFSAAGLGDGKIRRLMKRVELIGRPPRKPKLGIDSEVVIEMKSGALHRGHAAIARGHPELPPSRADIEEKFRHCAAPLLAEGRCAEFLKQFWTVEKAPSVAAWLRPLCPHR